jgi:carbon monoxide dehydrogenase subunit G
MDMTGEQLIPAPQKKVWDALNDPEVLKACVPGCESIQTRGANEFDVLMMARVGPVSAKFRGKLSLSDVNPPTSYSIAFDGQGGAAGFSKGGAKVTLAPETVDGRAGTKLSYVVNAHVGGKLAQIGSRLVDMAAKKIAEDFFTRFKEAVAVAGEDDHHEHAIEPVPRDPDLPKLDSATVAFFAAGSLAVTLVALFTLL